MKILAKQLILPSHKGNFPPRHQSPGVALRALPCLRATSREAYQASLRRRAATHRNSRGARKNARTPFPQINTEPKPAHATYKPLITRARAPSLHPPPDEKPDYPGKKRGAIRVYPRVYRNFQPN